MMRINNSSQLGLYIHVPFCKKKCNYCDFKSFEAVEEQLQRIYFNGLKKEFASYLNPALGAPLADRHIDTVFIGGGTPSLVPAEEIQGIMKLLFHFGQSPKEITIETNPGTLTVEKLQIYRESEINRISMGVQSMQGEELRFLGRIHDVEEVRRNIRLIRSAGFKNINLDLIFGIPGQTESSWMETLKQTVFLEPEHISFYSLQIEEGTSMYQWYREGRFSQIPDDINRQMYDRAIDYLQENGYVHYEFSNAAKPGYECIHNLKYWSMENYLGIGLGASSFVDGVRFRNEDDLQQYLLQTEYKNPSKRAQGRGFPISESHNNTAEENMSEFVFTGLRKVAGIKVDDFNRMFGISIMEVYGKEIKQLISKKLLERQGNQIYLTRKGIDISNQVLCEFI